ncbi:MAG TPA: glutamate racemase [Tepidisphaeraceae bacterium]|nr:glutamate racemase [Tepidisphaeraceae bacterium]
MSPNSPIVVLDSGLGGLTVVKALQEALPHDDLLYFGDTARLPYGSKSPATVTEFVRQIISYLRPHDPKHVVIACNTATALALPGLRGEFPGLSISGVIEPGARTAVEAAGSKQKPCIGVLATEATVRSKAYERAIHRRRTHARVLLRPTPLLVPIIEEGRDARDPLVQIALEQYLQPMIERGIDVLLLGCTHYPLLKGLMARIVGLEVPVIDSAQACAEDVHRRLSSAGLLRPGTRDSGWLKCFVTDDSPRFAELASRFLGVTIETPQWVPPAELYGMTLPAPLREAS